MTSLAPTDLSLLTDLYQLTMAQAYWHHGMADSESVFQLTFRRAPFHGKAAIVAGLGPALDYLEGFAVAPTDLEWLASLPAPAGGSLFAPGFLEWLGDQRMRLDVDALPEGSLALPNEPLLRVTGPLALAQIVETTLLNLVNFQTLIATKTARIVAAAAGREVLEFGLRRAQGPDGALGAARAAWIGGVAATSNVLAARAFGIPVRGTHAHAWVMAHDDEQASFHRWAEAMPGNALFLVDTWDTPTGVRRAIAAGLELKARGGRMLGIRLDSGDMGALAVQARHALDEAGLNDARIVASSDLDEHSVAALVAAGAPIDVFGVGTRLVTGHDQPALGGVYKLGALREPYGWRRCAKRSEDRGKSTAGGILQVRRSADGDVIWDTLDGEPDAPGEDVLVPVLRGGERVSTLDTSLDAARARAAAAIATGAFALDSTPQRVRWSSTIEKRLADMAAGAS